MRSVSVFYHGMFDTCLYIMPDDVASKNDIPETFGFQKTLKSYMGDNDVVCSSIIFKSQCYRNGDLVIIGIEDCDNLRVGLIKAILIKENEVYFLVKIYKATRNFLQYFESIKSTENVFEFVRPEKLKDFKPLYMRGTEKSFVFTLHHFVSFEYQ